MKSDDLVNGIKLPPDMKDWNDREQCVQYFGTARMLYSRNRDIYIVGA